MATIGNRSTATHGVWVYVSGICVAVCLLSPLSARAGDGPMAKWEFEGDAQDQTGTYHGTVTGAQLTDGIMGQAYHFDGDDYIQIPNENDFDFGTGDFSLSAWFKLDAGLNNNHLYAIVSKNLAGQFGGNYRGFRLARQWGGSLAFVLYGKDSTGNHQTYAIGIPSNAVISGQWYHVVAVKSDKLRLYLDGQLHTEGTGSIPQDFDYSTGSPLAIGAALYWGNGIHFKGDIDEVQVFDRALTASEIEELATFPAKQTFNVSDELPSGAIYEFGRDRQPLVQINADGHVGIGTTSPDERLTVDGNIKAKKVVVTLNGWSDFVFADDYDLMPLSRVEQYIKEHCRLPGVPSEAEVLEKGVDVGVVQAKLLEKIEELTLYMIELKHDNERLAERHTELRQRITELENALSK